MNVLTFTTLYPNGARPNFAVFVENRLRHVVATGEVQARVVAPVPWFFSRDPRFGEYATWARTPHQETRHGIEITHPRYPLVPRVGMTLAPVGLYHGALRHIRKLMAEGHEFDLIDAHYFYPDGVAATWLARKLGKPVVVTARGTDINLIPRYARPRKMIQAAGRSADAMVAVCQALKDEMVALGLPAEKITVLRNGVDLELFTPRDRDVARRKYRIHRPAIVSVGALIVRKAHDIAVRALAELPDMELLIAGTGPEQAALEALVAELGLEGRVRLLGAVPHDELPWLYSAADVMSLTSSREGWANVLLEAMACGTPVVASNVWGTPEVVAEPVAGVLMSERTPHGLAAAVRTLRENDPDRADVRRYAERFSWDETTRGQIEIFRRLAGK